MMLSIMLDVLNCAKAHNQYGYIAVTIPGQDALEYIINEPAALENKIEYYRKAYNADGSHRLNPDVKIVAAGCIENLPFTMADLVRE